MTPCFSPKSGEKRYLEVLSRFGLWRDFLNDNIQATISAFRLIRQTWQLIPNQGNFTSATLTHIRFVFFYHNIKDNERNLCQDLLTIENTDSGLESARAALCKWATCTCQTFLSKTFAKSLNTQKQYEKSVWEKNNDAYSLSIRVQNTINHISIFTFLCFFYDNINVKDIVFFLSASWKRHCATHWRERCGWDLVIFDWFALSMRMQVILDSSFARSGSAPIWGGKKGEFRDWTTLWLATLLMF